MALYEVPFTSTNGRDEIQAWIYTPFPFPLRLAPRPADSPDGA